MDDCGQRLCGSEKRMCRDNAAVRELLQRYLLSGGIELWQDFLKCSFCEVIVGVDLVLLLVLLTVFWVDSR